MEPLKDDTSPKTESLPKDEKPGETPSKTSTNTSNKEATDGHEVNQALELTHVASGGTSKTTVTSTASPKKESVPKDEKPEETPFSTASGETSTTISTNISNKEAADVHEGIQNLELMHTTSSGTSETTATSTANASDSARNEETGFPRTEGDLNETLESLSSTTQSNITETQSTETLPKEQASANKPKPPKDDDLISVQSFQVFNQWDERQLTLSISIPGRRHDDDQLCLNWDGQILPSQLFSIDGFDPPNLSLTDHFISEIPGEISQLKDGRLRVINFSGNSLEVLPDGFYELTKLERLNLSINQFEDVPEEMSNLSNLQLLNMSNNQISSILCETLPKIQSVNLSHNKLTSDSYIEYMAGWTTMVELNLEYNRLNSIDTALTSLISLKTLNLGHNHLVKFPSVVWDLESLEICKVHNNFITEMTVPQTIKSPIHDINVDHNYIEHVPLMSSLKTLRNFSAKSNFIDEVSGHFDGCHSIEQLDLSDNYIKVFTLKTEHLSKLKHLRLNTNYLRIFPECIWTLKALQVCSLRQNSLRKLDVKEPMAIHHLDVSCNKITEIDLQTPGNLRHLKVLDMHDNDLGELPNELGSMSELTKLNLGKNKFIAFPPALKALPKLEELVLNGEKDTFHDLTNDDIALNSKMVLKTLDLSTHQLSNLPENFIQLQNIENLNLSWNKLSKLPKKWNQCLRQLVSLNLSHNNFGDVNNELVLKKNNLKRLDLSENRIDKIPTKMPNMMKLEFIDLSGNHLSSLTDKFGTMETLKHVKLGGKEERGLMKKIPKVVYGLPNLEVLSVQKAKLKYIEIDCVTSKYWKQLTELNLSRNDLTSIPTGISYLSSLEVLNISHNHLEGDEDIPLSVRELGCLKYLNVSHNRLSKFPCHVVACIRLESVHLASNRITEFGEFTIDPRNNITILDLSSNKLETIPDALAGFRRLEILNLSNNQITDIPDEFEKGLPRLKSADLSRNRLTCLPKVVCQSDRRLQDCKLSANTLHAINEWQAAAELLELDDNEVDSIPDWIYDISDLHGLNVVANNMHEARFPVTSTKVEKPSTIKYLNISSNASALGNFKLHNGISYLMFLLELDLEDLGLTELPTDMKDLKYLKRISLAKNRLSRIPSFLKYLKRLKIVILSENEIEETSKAEMDFALLEEIQDIDLSQNQLTSVPVTTAQEQKSKLERYILSSNKISTITELITELPHLKELCLDDNRLKRVPKQVFQNNHMEKLILNANKIVSIEVPDETELATSKLKVLEISDNKLTEIEGGLALFARLETLDVSFNNIRSLPANTGLFKRLNMKQIVLNGNPVLNQFTEDNVKEYLTKEQAELKIKKSVKVLVHGNNTEDKHKLLKFLSNDDDLPECTGIAIAQNAWEMGDVTVKSYICDPNSRQTLPFLSSPGTIHFITFDPKAMNSQSSEWQEEYEKHVGRFLVDIGASLPFPIVRIIGIGDSSDTSTDQKLADAIKSTVGDLKQVLTLRVNTKMSQEGGNTENKISKKGAKSEVAQKALKDSTSKDAWMLSTDVIHLNRNDMEQSHTRLTDVMKDISEHESNLPRMPFGSKIWSQFMMALNDPNYNYFTRDVCLEIAKSQSIGEEEIKRLLDRVLIYTHETGGLICTTSGKKVKLAFHDSNWIFAVLKRIFTLQTHSFDESQLPTIFKDITKSDSTSEFTKQALQDILQLLLGLHFVYKIGEGKFTVPSLIFNNGAHNELKKFGDFTEVNLPKSYEEMVATVEVTTALPFGAYQTFLCYLSDVFDVLPNGDSDRNDRFDGCWGMSKKCNLFIVLNEIEKSMKFGYHKNPLIVVRIRGQVEEEAYDHHIQTVFEHKSLSGTVCILQIICNKYSVHILTTKRILTCR